MTASSVTRSEARIQAAAKAASLEDGFAHPPVSTKPAVYWYWISDNLSREGITKDLESMAKVGIGEAYIGNVDTSPQDRGKVKVLSEEWWGMVEHAVREGKRLGVKIGLFNCPGWSQSGGPWVKPTQTMR
ncbi:glycoside hydrolase family 2, partial [bacterium]